MQTAHRQSSLYFKGFRLKKTPCSTRQLLKLYTPFKTPDSENHTLFSSPPPNPLLGNIQKSEARDTRCIYCVVDKSLAPWVTHFQSESERRIEDLIDKPNPGQISIFSRLPFALDKGTSDINNSRKLKPITESAVTCGKESAVSQEILQIGKIQLVVYYQCFVLIS